MKQLIEVTQPKEPLMFFPQIKFRKILPISTATKVIRPLKGGGYRRKEKFQKQLTASD